VLPPGDVDETQWRKSGSNSGEGTRVQIGLMRGARGKVWGGVPFPNKGSRKKSLEMACFGAF